MKLGGIRVFADPEVLKEMLSLRQKGWSLHKLADYFHVDHSSILYQIQRNGFPSKKRIPCPRKNPSYIGAIHKPIYKQEIELSPTIREKINLGTDYATYLKRENLRTASKARILIESFKIL